MSSILEPSAVAKEFNYLKTLSPKQTIVDSRIEQNEIHLFLEPLVDPQCPSCGKTTNRIHDFHERVVRDIDFEGFKVFLHVKMRRVRCPCGCVGRERIDWLGKRLRITNRMVAYAQSLLASGMTISAVSRQLKLDWDLIKKLNLWRLRSGLTQQKSEP